MLHRRVRTLALVPALLVIALSAARADEVKLRNGDRMHGKVKRLEGGTLVFAASYGEARIPQKEVLWLRMDEKLRVGLPGRAPVPLALRTDDEGRFRFGGKKLRIADILSIAPPEEKKTEADLWSGSLAFSLTVADGNTDTAALHGEMSLLRDQSAPGPALRTRLGAGLSYDYGWSGGEVTAHAGRAWARLDLFLAGDLAAYLDGSVAFDALADVDRRTAAGLGLSWTSAWEGWKYALSAGLTYLDILYDETPLRRDTGLYLKVAGSLEGELPFGGLGLRAKGEVTPSFEEPERFWASGEVALTKALEGGWFFRISVSYAYNSHPAAGKERGDALLAFSLAFRF